LQKHMQQKLVLWFTALAVALGSMAGLAVKTAAAETTAAPLVISAVQITGGEGKTAEDFIELYNPNPFPVDLNGYRLVKRSATGLADASIKSFAAATPVPAYSFYLWANSGFSSIAALPDTTTSATLANDNGVGLRFGTLDTGQLIDSVAWGTTGNGFTATGLGNPAAGESVRRADLFENLGYELAPSSPRNSTVQVLPEDIPAITNNSACSVSPSSFSASSSQTVAVSVQFTNTGNSVWEPESYKVRQLSPAGTLDLALGTSSVNPAASLELALPIVAPDQAGQFSYQWQMTAGENLFGQSCLLQLTVVAPEPDPEPDPEPIPTTLKITEFLPNPVGEDSGGEVIELYNYGAQTIDLQNLILDDADTWPASTNAYLLPQQNIAAGQYLAVTIPAGKFGLNNTGGDIVTLFSSSGSIISSVVYTGTAAEGKTYSLVDGAWHWTAPSLGVVNPALPVEDPEDPPADDDEDDPPADNDDPPAPVGLIISELYPAPHPGGSEFVELYNGTNTAVNLQSIKLAIGNRVASLPNFDLPSGGYYAVSGAGLKLPLADAGKTIQLLSTSGELLDEVSYPKARKGESYAWFEDSFFWTQTPTPNAENVLLVAAPKVAGTQTKPKSAIKQAVKDVVSSVVAPKSNLNKGAEPSVSPSQPAIPAETTSPRPKLINALAIALASLGAGVFAIYKFSFTGL
jgi:hypothetical protein